MALSDAIVWEVRYNGSDTNGGGFKAGAAGTDWTLQDAAQYSVTDGVTDGTTTITSATAAFGADVVGNVIYVQGGTGSVTAGWYEITARASSTSITVDRATGLTAGTGVTLKIGGALATPGRAMTDDCMVNGNKVFIKYNASPYLVTTTTIGPSGPMKFTDYTSGKAVIGYDTTRTATNTDANRPTIQAGAALGACTLVTTGGSAGSILLSNVILDGNNRTGVNGYSGNTNTHQNTVRCQATRCGWGFGAGMSCFGCTADNNSSYGFNESSRAEACYAYSNGNSGFYKTPAMGCVSRANTGKGFEGSPFGNWASNCVAYGNTSDGFTSSGYERGYYINCVAWGNSGYGFVDISGTSVLQSCAMGSNTSGAVSGSGSFQFGNITLTVDPFTNAAAGDFSLNTTAGGGALLKGTGYPAAFPVI